jgi:hypothetical protein
MRRNAVRRSNFQYAVCGFALGLEPDSNLILQVNRLKTCLKQRLKRQFLWQNGRFKDQGAPWRTT